MAFTNAIKSMLVATTIAVMSFSAATADELKAKSVVLIHGAFADGSSWNRVIPFLKQAGLEVISVQNPLVSLANDVEFANRAIERAKGPVVLVAHSWGGVVITEAGNNDKVQSLVYVAAYAPGKDQSLLDIANEFPTPPGIEALVGDEYGFLHLPDDAMRDHFAQDLSHAETSIMAANQGPIKLDALSEKVSIPAWENKPVWYAISEQDHMTPADLQRALVKKMKATSISLDSSHVSMLSHPRAIANLIIDAAK